MMKLVTACGLAALALASAPASAEVCSKISVRPSAQDLPSKPVEDGKVAQVKPGLFRNAVAYKISAREDEVRKGEDDVTRQVMRQGYPLFFVHSGEERGWPCGDPQRVVRKSVANGKVEQLRAERQDVKRFLEASSTSSGVSQSVRKAAEAIAKAVSSMQDAAAKAEAKDIVGDLKAKALMNGDASNSPATVKQFNLLLEQEGSVKKSMSSEKEDVSRSAEMKRLVEDLWKRAQTATTPIRISTSPRVVQQELADRMNQEASR